jgi:hypothetical protein
MPIWPYDTLRLTAPDTGTPPTTARILEAQRLVQEARREFVVLPPGVNMRMVGGRPVYEFTGDPTAVLNVMNRRMPLIPFRVASGQTFEVTEVSTADPTLVSVQLGKAPTPVTGRLRPTVSATVSATGASRPSGTRPSSVGATLPFTAVAMTFGDMAAQTEAAMGQLAGRLSLTSEAMRRVYQELLDRLGEAVESQLWQRPIVYGRVRPPEPPAPPPPPTPPRPTVADLGGERLISFDDEEA